MELHQHHQQHHPLAATQGDTVFVVVKQASGQNIISTFIFPGLNFDIHEIGRMGLPECFYSVKFLRSDLIWFFLEGESGLNY